MTGPGIEAPYAIASVPNPLDSTYGQVQASPVFGFKESRKRKRHEVAVGIDGEGINIYNVQNHNLITSYALPPQSYLCCPPGSYYDRPTPDTGARRTTFAVIKSGHKDSKRRLLSFVESVKKKNADNTSSGLEKRECKLHNGDVLSLDVIPISTDKQHTIVTNYRNGSVELVSGDLSKTHWEEWSALTEDEIEVEYAAVLDLDSASKGVLKARKDVLALLEQNNASDPNTNLLCRLVRAKEKRRLELYAIRNSTQTSLQTPQNALKHLTSYELPSTSKRSTNAAQYDLHSASGTLYQLLDGKLNIYDLSGTVPRLVSGLGGRQAPVSSFTRVAASSVTTFSKDFATLFETSFGSVQATIAFSRASISASNGRKRKRDDSEGPVVFSAVSTFSDLGLVVGLFGHELIAFQLNKAFAEGNESKSQVARLSDVIGKGDTGEIRDSKSHGKKGDEWTAKIDALVAQDDVEGLEKLVANDPRLGRQRKPKRNRNESEANGLPDGHDTAYQELWPLPETFDPQKTDKAKTLYILSKTFGNGDHRDDSLKVLIRSSKLLEWLALTGYLSASYLKKAFHSNTNDSEAFHTSWKPGDIMTAIHQIDGNFQLVRELLSLPVHWEAPEVLQALRLVINSFDAPNQQDPQLALPAPPQPNGDVEMTNGEADSSLEDESKAAENELDFVMSALTTGLEVRSDTLRVIILRLHDFPPNVITSAMRSMMSHEEIVFFIHILRIELADGGWTSQYVDAGEDDIPDGLVNTIGGEEEKGGPSDQAIQAIGNLLNCAVDAIGTSGWLVGQSSSALRTDSLIDSLRNEVSAGLEGCYEASTLGTLFAELEKCAASVGKSLAKTRLEGVNDDEVVDGEELYLPLGSRVKPTDVPGRSERGTKKTKMAIGREKSRRVGKYSFDRIRI